MNAPLSAAERLKLIQKRNEIAYEKACIEARTIDGFDAFCRVMTLPDGSHNMAESIYRDLPFMRFLRSKYVQVAKKTLMKLSVSMPPQHGKSWTGFLFLAWYLGIKPRARIAYVSYSQSFSEEQLGHIKAFMKSETYLKIFPHHAQLSKDSVSIIETKQGGVLSAKSHGGSTTGKALDLVWVDDLYAGDEFGTKEEQTIADWFMGNIISRLRKNTALVMIGTRWSENDMIGRLADPRHPDYKTKPGHADQVDSWGLINIPAILNDQAVVDMLNMWVYPHEAPYVLGQALDQEEHPLEPILGYTGLTLKDKQVMMGSLFFSLYQGTPTPDEGFDFKKEWIRTHTPFLRTPRQRTYMAVDFALTNNANRDGTAIVVGVLDEDGRQMRITDIYNERKQAPEMAKRMVDLMIKHKPDIVFTEKGKIWAMMNPTISDEMIRRGVWFTFHAINPSDSKVIRTIALKTLMMQDRWSFAAGATWMAETTEQLLKFPNGTFDDIVDALAWLAIGVSKMMTSAVGGVGAAPPPDLTSAQILAASLRQARARNQRSLLGKPIGNRCL